MQAVVTFNTPEDRPIYAISFSPLRRLFRRSPGIPEGFERMIEAVLGEGTLIKPLEWITPPVIP